ncbi:MAG: peptidase M15, partial [Cyanobacteria bacterium P01_H01_bin.153]
FYEQTQDWTTLAWWIHDHIPDYASMMFFPKYAAFNISWRENPNFTNFIFSHFANPHTGKKGYLTKKGMENFEGDHSKFYKPFIEQI